MKPPTEQLATPAHRGPGTESQDADCGRAALAAYVRSARLNRVEPRQDYTITDAIVALLKLAREQGFDARSLDPSALDHFEAEEPLLWIEDHDGGYPASWPRCSGANVFAIRRHGRTFVLTYYRCGLRAVEGGDIHTMGEYDSSAEAKVDAQKFRQEW